MQERGLNESSFSMFWQKENFILPFAANVMRNLSINIATANGLTVCFITGGNNPQFEQRPHPEEKAEF